jgi:dTMP kinase
LTLLFDVPVEVGRERLTQARDGGALDKFERERGEFFARVRDAYLERARADSRRMRVIDATRSPAAVRSELAAIMEEAL